jgi:hypothetical protein
MGSIPDDVIAAEFAINIHPPILVAHKVLLQDCKLVGTPTKANFTVMSLLY